MVVVMQLCGGAAASAAHQLDVVMSGAAHLDRPGVHHPPAPASLRRLKAECHPKAELIPSKWLQSRPGGRHDNDHRDYR